MRQGLTYLFRLDKIMYLFWFFFWTLNGLDKFFNGTPEQHAEYGKFVRGWFGVNRDDKFIHYFDRLGLSDWMALTSLYVFAIVEIFAGLMFIWIYFKRNPRSSVVRLAFKIGILLFMAFSIGDILFGDRLELWEHGTFFILTLLTYQLYLQRSDEYAEIIGDSSLGAADLNKDGRISCEEFTAFMLRVQREGVDNPENEPEEGA